MASRIVLLLVLSGCAARRAPAVPSPVLPAPFEAAELRRAMPVGAHLRLHVLDEGEPSWHEWTVVEADAYGALIRYEVEDRHGEAVQSPSERHDPWGALHAQAVFRADTTTREREQFDSALGTFRGWRYDVRDPLPEGAVRLRSFWFAEELPGPPVRMVVEIDGDEVFRMEQVERAPR